MNTCCYLHFFLAGIRDLPSNRQYSFSKMEGKWLSLSRNNGMVYGGPSVLKGKVSGMNGGKVLWGIIKTLLH